MAQAKRERFGSKVMTAYSPEKAMEVIEGIVRGDTLTTICKKKGMPHRVTFYKWLSLYPDLKTAYDAARELSAQAMEDQALDMATELRRDGHTWKGTAVRAYEVAMQQLRWSAARRDPGRYGQRAETNTVIPIQINTSLDLNVESEAMEMGQGVIRIEAKMPNADATPVVSPLEPPEDPERLFYPKKGKDEDGK